MNYKEILDNFEIDEFYIYNYYNHYMKIVKCIYYKNRKSFQFIKNINNCEDHVGVISPIDESAWWKYTKLTNVEKIKYL